MVVIHLCRRAVVTINSGLVQMNLVQINPVSM